MTTAELQRSRADSCKPKGNLHYVLGTVCPDHATTADRMFLTPRAKHVHLAGEEPVLVQGEGPAVPRSPSLPTSSCSTLCTRSSFTAM